MIFAIFDWASARLTRHFRRLPIEAQHLDFGHDLLLVEPAGEGKFTVQQF